MLRAVLGPRPRGGGGGVWGYINVATPVFVRPAEDPRWISTSNAPFTFPGLYAGLIQSLVMARALAVVAPSPALP